jgi:hypothetical protein
MIKRILESIYSRTVGALRNALSRRGRLFSSGTSWIQLLYAIVVVAFMAGFVSAVFFPVADQSAIVYPAAGAQTFAETILDAVVIVFGAGGIYVAYLSGRQTTKPRMVNLYLAIALLLVVVSVFMGIQLSILKG